MVIKIWLAKWWTDKCFFLLWRVLSSICINLNISIFLCLYSYEIIGYLLEITPLRNWVVGNPLLWCCQGESKGDFTSVRDYFICAQKETCVFMLSVRLSSSRFNSHFPEDADIVLLFTIGSCVAVVDCEFRRMKVIDFDKYCYKCNIPQPSLDFRVDGNIVTQCINYAIV